MRVLVTRAETQAAGLAEALRALGAEPVVIPAIAIAPPASYQALDEAIAGIAGFVWVVFTSANGVDGFFERGGAVPGGVRVAAIGSATARAVEDAGMRVDLVPERAVAEALAEALAPFVAVDDRVLIVRAEQGRDVVPEALRAAGAEVVVAAAYRNVVPESSVEALRALFAGAGVDAVTFTSSSSVTNLLELMKEAGVTLPASVRRVSIGPITSETLRAAGIAAHAEAREATVEALAEACLTFGDALRPKS